MQTNYVFHIILNQKNYYVFLCLCVPYLAVCAGVYQNGLLIRIMYINYPKKYYSFIEKDENYKYKHLRSLILYNC